MKKSRHVSGLFKFCGEFFLLALILSMPGCSGKNSGSNKEIPVQVENKISPNYAQPSIPKKSERKQGEKVIPKKVREVLQYIRQHHEAPDGYVGGKRFGNFERLLPIRGQNGKKLTFKEWDVNPRRNGGNRGAERLITSNDNRAWYTSDHYRSFVEIP